MKTLINHTSLENVPFKQSFIYACIPLVFQCFIGLSYTVIINACSMSSTEKISSTNTKREATSEM